MRIALRIPSDINQWVLKKHLCQIGCFCHLCNYPAYILPWKTWLRCMIPTRVRKPTPYPLGIIYVLLAMDTVVPNPRGSRWLSQIKPQGPARTWSPSSIPAQRHTWFPSCPSSREARVWRCVVVQHWTDRAGGHVIWFEICKWSFLEPKLGVVLRRT